VTGYSVQGNDISDSIEDKGYFNKLETTSYFRKNKLQ
jgi:hypothetical protein